MSRHDLKLLDGQPAEQWVCVGWDAPLGTFWAQVFDASDPTGEVIEILWTGTCGAEITDEEIVLDQVRPYAHIPEDLGVILRADRWQEGSRFFGRPPVHFATGQDPVAPDAPAPADLDHGDAR